LRSPFVVPVTSILRSREPERVRVEGPLPDLFVPGSAVPIGGVIALEVLLEPVGDSIEAVGVVSAPWDGECGRCLRPVSGTLTGEVEEVYEPHPVEGESWPLTHGEIDLEPLARETVVLELPQAPLCREDCLGLCPTCGVDRNESPCDCAPPADPRWAALDQLRDPQT